MSHGPQRPYRRVHAELACDSRQTVSPSVLLTAKQTSKDWATFNNNTLGCRAGSQRTPIQVISGPTEIDVLQPQAQV
ncbi:hypothetical protein OPV22_009384 [Ensete ventricosum]|uniref:Uncharacterized protein n=1 Tax=Ensete ventricosum TaxID=4639 RepID=A0AAV8RD72_ENSVE|nr:hypothetical protein OPV22_009384 [Ensete ventricosum]